MATICMNIDILPTHYPVETLWGLEPKAFFISKMDSCCSLRVILVFKMGKFCSGRPFYFLKCTPAGAEGH